MDNKVVVDSLSIDISSEDKAEVVLCNDYKSTVVIPSNSINSTEIIDETAIEVTVSNDIKEESSECIYVKEFKNMNEKPLYEITSCNLESSIENSDIISIENSSETSELQIVSATTLVNPVQFVNPEKLDLNIDEDEEDTVVNRHERFLRTDIDSTATVSTLRSRNHKGQVDAVPSKSSR